MTTRWAARRFERLYRLMRLALSHGTSSITLNTVVQATRGCTPTGIESPLIPRRCIGQDRLLRGHDMEQLAYPAQKRCPSVLIECRDDFLDD